MGTPFMLDDQAVADLHALRTKAEARPYTEQDMRAMMEMLQAGHFEPPQRNIDQTITLPFGYTVTFTIEWQPMGQCRHVSMASPRANRIPIEAAMDMILPALGFIPGRERHAWAEMLSDDRIAHNIVEIITPERDTMANSITEYSTTDA
jgi:hypothetical protein